MSQGRILVVDDTAHNVKLLADLLGARGYEVVTAASGAEALERLAAQRPDLVLLDVVMPGMSGYEVCRAIRAAEATRLLPVVMVTALDPSEERVKGIEAGADDFLAKPIQTAELFARVRSLLRIRELHEMVRSQAEQLSDWNQVLERRVAEQVEKLARLERLRGFFSPQIAELIAGDGRDLLEPHRRRVTVVFLDLRGFTSFAESAEPEDMMELLREYHAEMGRLVLEHEGTLERFTGDGLMVFFNDPVAIDEPELRAVAMAVRMRECADRLLARWKRLGHELALGIGITSGYATLGMIGFEGRWDYAALGSVTNHAARLCDAARAGQILVSERVFATVEARVHAEPVGELELKGLRSPARTHNVLALRD
jgi:adenylate cyclase